MRSEILGKRIQQGLQGASFSALEIKQFPNKMEARQLDGTLFTTHQVIKEELSGALGSHSAVKLLSGLALCP